MDTPPAAPTSTAPALATTRIVPASRLTVVTGPRRPARAGTVVFAVVSVLVALGVVGLTVSGGLSAAPSRTPEQTVREFLAATFLAKSQQRVSAVVCSGWDPADAIAGTSAEFDPAIRVTWDEFEPVTVDDNRAAMRVRLRLRDVEQLRPSSYVKWRFSLVNQDGWRVCEARPIDASVPGPARPELAQIE